MHGARVLVARSHDRRGSAGALSELDDPEETMVLDQKLARATAARKNDRERDGGFMSFESPSVGLERRLNSLARGESDDEESSDRPSSKLRQSQVLPAPSRVGSVSRQLVEAATSVRSMPPRTVRSKK